MLRNTVRIRPFDAHVEVAEGETLLDAILRAGHYVHHGCRNGRCGACLARVRSGELSCNAEASLVLSESDRRDGKLLLCRSFMTAGSAEIDVGGMQLDEAEFARGVESWTAELVHAEAPAPSLRLLTLQTLGKGPRWRAGAHLSIELPDGSGRRSYSLVDLPRADGTFRLLVRVLPQGRFSSRVDELAREATKLRIRGPLGNFSLRPGHWPAVFIAGGTGIAPIHAMLQELAEARSRRPIRVLYGARNRAELALLDDLRQRSERLPQLTLAITQEAPPQTAEEGGGCTAIGDVSKLIDRTLDDADVYLCGPAAMVEVCRARLAALGLRPRRVSSDSFVPSS